MSGAPRGQPSRLSQLPATFAPRAAPHRPRAPPRQPGRRLRPGLAARRCCRAGAAAAEGGMPGVKELDTAVIIVDHGSRRPQANQMLEEFAEAYREITGRRAVEVAHMELAEPSIGDAVAACVARGHRAIVVAPYFLSRGRHISADIPALVREAALTFPDVRITVAEPIGVDPLMVQLIEKRVQEALGLEAAMREFGPQELVEC